MSQESKIVLGYWDIRSLAERIRHLLEYTGLAYDQVFYSESKEDQWFKVDKLKLIEKNPAINLPYLIDGEKVISESFAICVYICHRSNRLDLLGRNAEEQVLLATAYGIYKDFYPQYITLVYGEYAETSWEEALKNYSLKFEAHFKKLSGLLGNKEYICGGLTWFDFALADTIQAVNKMNPEIFQKTPNLIEHQKRVWALPELAAYFQSDRWHEHPINGDFAKWR